MLTISSAQEREDHAIEVENALGSVAIGLFGCCPECQSAYGMEPREFYRAVHVDHTVNDEGGFSWHNCELCNSPLGGDRYAAHASKQVNGRWQHTHLDVCVDCLFAVDNGEPYPDPEMKG